MTKTVKAAPVTTKPTAAPASTTDKGTVHVGGGSMRFATTTKDAGKVHVGGGSMRF
jgi:hypothetical protein